MTYMLKQIHQVHLSVLFQACILWFVCQRQKDLFLHNVYTFDQLRSTAVDCAIITFPIYCNGKNWDLKYTKMQIIVAARL